MIRHTVLEPRFVKGVPRELEKGILYVSMEYGTVVHSCCCGCGNEVVTPLTPNDWTLTFNGEHVSLWPSVGNWNLPCKSHYVIKGNRAIDAGPWSKSRIHASIQHEQERKREYYKTGSHSAEESLSIPTKSQSPSPPKAPPQKASRKSRFIDWLNGK